jgi:hypothetical protein
MSKYGDSSRCEPNSPLFRYVFLLVFGIMKVSWIPESYVGICGFLPVQALRCHVTTSVFYVTVNKMCTQTPEIIPYWSFGDTIPVPTVAWVHFCPQKIWFKILPALVAMLFAR